MKGLFIIMKISRKITVFISFICLFMTTVQIQSSQIKTTQQIQFLFDFDPETYIEMDITGVAYGQELLWKANTTGTNYEESAVTYVDGIAYIGSCSTHGAGHDKIFAVDTTTGVIIWSNDTGPGYVGPVIDGDVVYIGSSTHGYYPDDEYMYAFNRFTGEQLWKTPIYGGIAESVQYDETKIYFASGFYDTKMYALNKDDGSINWTFPTGFYVCPNKPMLKDNMIYGAFWDNYNTGKLYKINATTGQEVWSVSLSAGPWDNSITADGQGRLFLAIYYDSTMNAYSEYTGQLLWTYPLHGGSLSFNAYHNGCVFIADTFGYVYALNVSTGHLLWEKNIGGSCDISSPTISGGLLFIGTRDGADGAFYALNESTGSILWKYSIGASVTAPPSIVDGMMLCGSDGWNMYAFDVGLGDGDWLFHRYDRLNTAYSPVGLNTWQYIRAECSTDHDRITCVVTNVYDHDMQNILLHLPFSAYWYTETGELLKEDSDTYTLESLSAGASQTLLISQEPLFQASITRPEKGLYIANMKILPFFVPLVIGTIEIQASVQEINKSQIARVEFYIDDELQAADTEAPYSWVWNQRSFGAHMMKVVAYKNDTTASDELKIWKIW
jgi:outer membrane protein assembly factor BamB